MKCSSLQSSELLRTCFTGDNDIQASLTLGSMDIILRDVKLLISFMKSPVCEAGLYAKEHSVL